MIIEFTLYNDDKIAINMDKVVAINTDGTHKTKNTIISFSGGLDDYVEVKETYEEVLKAWETTHY